MQSVTTQPFSLLISDLHLRDSDPSIFEHLQSVLHTHAVGAHALYVLGDLFEYWLGDDTLDHPWHAAICRAFAERAEAGTQLFFMHGNRDFLLGDAFAKQSRMTLLTDPTLVNLHGTPTLLLHGDTLCTDDIDYLAFRRQVRDTTWQRWFVSRPLDERIAMAQTARAQSQAAQHDKTPQITDVNNAAVEQMLRQHHYPRMIHGHTHRPMCHQHQLDGHLCERWVLPDWRTDQTGWLRCDMTGCRIEYT